MSKRKLIALGAVLFLSFETLTCKADNDELTQQLYKITRRPFEKPSDFALAEAECLKLIHEDSGASIKGQVYLAIEKMYAKDIGDNAQKIIEYCGRALENDQNAPNSCQVYVDWGSVLEFQYQNPRDTEARHKIVTPYLRGFALVYTNQVPEKLQSPPGVGRYDYGGSVTDAMYLALVKEHDDQMKVREKVDNQNALVMCRATLVDVIVSLYGRSPGAIEELRAAANEELHDQGVVNDLMGRVKDSAGSSALRQMIR